MSRTVRANNYFLKGLLVILSLVLLFTLNAKPLFAQEGSSGDSVSMSLLDSSARSVEVLINYQLDREVNDYSLTVEYPEYLVYKDINEGSVNCSPELITVEENKLSLSCDLGPYQTLDQVGSIATIVFQIEGGGSEQISFSRAQFGGEAVFTNELVVQSDFSDSRGYIFSNFTVEDAILWLGIVCLVGIGIALYVHITGKGRKRKNDQLVFASLLIVITVSGLSAIVLAMGVNDFELREEASVRSCTTSCSGKTCGPDGCGGTCGVCDEGYMCGEDGQCEWANIEAQVGEIYSCEKDYDCIKVDAGCCPCSSGGSEKAINRDKEYLYDESLGCTFDFACPTVYNCTESFAVCRNKRCVLEHEGVLGASTIQPNIVDLNLDGLVTIHDYAIFLSDYQNWQYNGYLEGRSDLNEDGEISTFDYLIFIEEYFEK